MGRSRAQGSSACRGTPIPKAFCAARCWAPALERSFTATVRRAGRDHFPRFVLSAEKTLATQGDHFWLRKRATPRRAAAQYTLKLLRRVALCFAKGWGAIIHGPTLIGKSNEYS